MAKSSPLILLLACLSVVLTISHFDDTLAFKGVVAVATEQLQLATILPKLEAIHQDSKSLLTKNAELKVKILAGLKAQKDAELKIQSSQQGSSPKTQQQPPNRVDKIDYAELNEFNEWVDYNLDYAVKNTKVTIETLKEEAQQNNGLVEYSEQPIKDGIEGVKYWQMGIIFQDKTIKNENFDIESFPVFKDN